MKNIFIDCGTHKGEGLTEFYNRGIISDGFKVHCFEPIPEITNLESLKNIKANNGKKLGDCLDINFSNCAIWIKDGEIVFNSRNDHCAHVNGIGYSFNDPDSFVQTLIKSIDLSAFIDGLPEYSNIVCKMDIEGSEFIVLRHLLDNNSIEKISEIYIEFHPHFMSDFSQENVDELVTELSKKTKVFLWH